MPRGFPPQPVFPQAIDSDYTLYVVYNTTESHISVDNEPWAEEIAIHPIPVGDPEVRSELKVCGICRSLAKLGAKA
jgi:hypothetical protein